MQQRKPCGCGEGPSLAAQLARAPIIRERMPPPARVAASLRGRLRWGLIDRAGREVRGGEQENLVLDQGLDHVTAHMLVANTTTGAEGWFPIIAYAAVGTDNTAPAVGQTSLGAEVGRTATRYVADALARPSNGVYELVKSIEFDFAVGNGNLTEWGFSYASAAGGNLFNRELFRDGYGDPEVITKTTEYKLRLIYTLEITLSPVVWTAASFVITGVGTVNGNYMLVGGEMSLTVTFVAPDLRLFSTLARGVLGTYGGPTNRASTGSLRAFDSDQSGTTYLSHITGGSNVDLAGAILEARDAYTPGSFERTGGAWQFLTSNANYDPIRALGITGIANLSFSPYAYQGYMFDFALASEFTKDDEHVLTIGVPTVTWGRA
jgi:hypothetical protein